MKVCLSASKIATVVKPITTTSTASIHFFLIKKNRVRIEYAGNKNREDPKKVMLLKNLVARGDCIDNTARKIDVSNPLSCSKTISSVIDTNAMSVIKNNIIARIKRLVTHLVILFLMP